MFGKKKKEEKKAAKPAKKVEPAKKAPAKKAAPAKKPAPAKKAEPAKKPAAKKAAPANDATRTYHVVKRKEDGKWEVKFAGGQKAIKLFDTQKEAIEYSKKMAENQGGAMLVHNSKGANKGKIKKK